jgi:hypothetical protein
MKRLLQLLLVILNLQVLCRAEVTSLPTDVQKSLREAARFHEVFITSMLPETLWEFWKHGNVRLEESGTNSTAAAITKMDDLPHRLIWVETDGDYYVFHYEIGGNVHSFHVLVVKLKHTEDTRLDRANFVWAQLANGSGIFQHFSPPSRVTNWTINGAVFQFIYRRGFIKDER